MPRRPTGPRPREGNPTRPSGAGRVTPLTRDEIMSAALRIVDEDGLEKLSMRRLARQLGVEAMSLYHHVASKDALLSGIAEAVMLEMRLPDPLPEDWMGILEAMLLAFRRALAAHPNAVPILMTRPLATPTTAGYVEAPLKLLALSGFSPQHAGALYQTAIAYTLGHALIAGLDPANPADSPIRAADSAEKYPGIVGSGITPWQFDEPGYVQAIGVIMRGYAELAGDGN